MTRRLLVFDEPDRFVCGTVGPAGERTFFLQAVQGRRIASVALEKVQVAVLAERLGQLLGELERRGIESSAAAEEDLDRPLDEPLREEFRVGTIALSWDDDDGVMIVEARAQIADERMTDLEVDDDDADGPDLVRVRLSPPAVRGFVERAARVLSAGRPPCPFCGEPLEPTGHICVRRNGYMN